ncbi:hypothetical protein EUGRSUZ_G00956 [Eucalyptus grandis]|uniref:Uncharacterized protein n=2 Tax=Eucalyptus grandis TaxID=71139 RepID=A0ACC3K1R8_EUCGR|nr:hypothetical protein EUGRSUZ_G00956 [Eucalyptus grandis]
MVINHGMPESQMKATVDAFMRFFDLTDEEKSDFQGKNLLNPIICGTSINTSVDKVLFWRDYLKVKVHPEFHCPTKPEGLRGDHKFNTAGESSAVNAVDLIILRVIMEEIKF